MSAGGSNWPRSAWFWGLLFLFFAHALAVFWLGERREFKPAWQKPHPFFVLGGDKDYDQRLAEAAALRDPTLFALPHENGFSGGAWLNYHPELAPPTNWVAPPEWLALDATRLGGALQDYMATNRPSESRLLASLRVTRPPETRVADEPILTATTVQLQPGSTRRRLLSQPKAPSVPLADLPGRTVVAVTVNGDGLVESASVARESSSKWADERALELARRLEFEPLPARNFRERSLASPTTARIVFNWHAVPPTNAAITASAR